MFYFIGDVRDSRRRRFALVSAKIVTTQTKKKKKKDGAFIGWDCGCVFA